MHNPSVLYRYEEIASQIAESLNKGDIPLGSRLPSLRRMSQRYQCSLSVVMQAYEVLEAQGKIYAVEKSGFFACDLPGAPIPAPEQGEFSLESEKAEPLSIIGKIVEASNNPSILPLGAGVPDESFLPMASIKRELSWSIKQHLDDLALYSDEQGLKELREEIAKIMQLRGVSVESSEILITNGCTEALSLSVQSSTSPGDTVAVESPVFLGIIQILNQLKRRILPVPTSSDRGMDLKKLEDVLKREDIKAVVMSSLYQNPLGFVMAESQREKAAKLAEQYAITLIEDDIYHDCGFRSRAEKPIKSFDRSHNVIYCSSFSKTVAPGLRIGWLIGGRKHRRCRNLKMAQSLGGNIFMQRALTRYLQSSRYDSHLVHLQKIMTRQSLEMRKLLGDALPPGTAISQPRGGYYLWVELPGEIDCLMLFETLLKKGISMVPGQAFSTGERYRNCMRISFSAPISEKTKKAVQTMADLIY